jgi:hypothetical protein
MKGSVAIRLTACCLAAAAALLLSACEQGGHFTVGGYTTRPNYDPDIRTVRVAIFGNETFYRSMEFQLTEAVIREIEWKTPYKVVPAGCAADTELVGKIIQFNKGVLNFTNSNDVRDVETTMAIELTWRDLRAGHPGDVLSAPPPKVPGSEQLHQNVMVIPVPPTLVQSQGSFRPELAQSLASAQKQMIDRMAVQIVSMMEKW